MTQPFNLPLLGRDIEIDRLHRLFSDVASKSPSGCGVGPRAIFVVGESGLGKSRLVQELYARLSSSPIWDPEDIDYWPPAFQQQDGRLRTNPDLRLHEPKGPPKFFWLGARLTEENVRNAQDDRSIVPTLQALIMSHARTLLRYQSIWVQSKRDLLGAAKEEAPTALFTQICAALGLPLVGPAFTVIKTVTESTMAKMRGAPRFDQADAEQREVDADRLIESLRALMEGRGAVPVILWVDDAHWLDKPSSDFLSRLWKEATRRSWPLLLVLTTWEREWRTGVASTGSTFAELMSDGPGNRRTDPLILEKASAEALEQALQQTLPGLTSDQRLLLVEKAAGNYLTLLENVGELRGEPMWFIGQDVNARLTEAAERHIYKFEGERERRVEQRFKALEADIKKLLGWSAQLGSKFIAQVVVAFAGTKASGPRNERLLEACVDPYTVLGRSSELTREFRDKLYHRAAGEYADRFLSEDRNELRSLFERYLRTSVDSCFGPNGEISQQESPRAVSSRPVALKDMEPQDRQYALDAAILLFEPQYEMVQVGLDVMSRWVRVLYLASSLAFEGRAYRRIQELMGHLRRLPWDRLPPNALSMGARREFVDIAWESESFDVAAQLLRTILREPVQQAGGDVPNVAERRKQAEDTLKLARAEAESMNAPDATSNYVAAVSAYRALVSEWPTSEAKRELGNCLELFGCYLYDTEDYGAAYRILAESLEIARERMAQNPSMESRRAVAYRLERVHSAAREAEGVDLPEGLLEESQELEEAIALSTDDPYDWFVVSQKRFEQAFDKALGFLTPAGDREYRERGFELYADAITAWRRARELDQAGVYSGPLSAQLIRNAAIAADFDHTSLARSWVVDGLAILRQSAEERGSSGSRIALFKGLVDAAEVVQKCGDADSARAYCEEALRGARELAGSAESAVALQALGDVLGGVSIVFEQRNDLGRATDCALERVNACERLVEKWPAIAHSRSLEESIGRLATLYERQGELSRAWSALDRALSLKRESGRLYPAELGTAGDLLFSLGRFEESKERFQECHALCMEELDAWGTVDQMADSLAGLARAELKLGDWFAAMRRITEFLDVASQELPGLPEGDEFRVLLYRRGFDVAEGVLQEFAKQRGDVAIHQQILELSRAENVLVAMRRLRELDEATAVLREKARLCEICGAKLGQLHGLVNSFEVFEEPLEIDSRMAECLTRCGGIGRFADLMIDRIQVARRLISDEPNCGRDSLAARLTEVFGPTGDLDGVAD